MQETLNYEVPLVSRHYADRFFSFLQEKGISRDAILEHAPEIKDLVSKEAGYLSVNQVVPFIKAASWLLNDEKAAFEFGQQLDLFSHGLFGYSLLNQHDHPRLIESVVKHLQVCLPLFEMKVLRKGDNIIIRLQDTWDIGETRAFIAKIYMGSIYTIASSISKNMTIEYDFGSSKDESEWSSLTPDTEWAFNAEFNQITLPLVRQNEKNTDIKKIYLLAQQKLSHNTTSDDKENSTVTNKVREHIRKSPRIASIERSAELMGISARYLRQKLAAEGTTFRDINNEIKQSYADLYLCKTMMPIHDISHKLGYGDQASFTRAYRGWTGITPGEMRRNHQIRDMAS